MLAQLPSPRSRLRRLVRPLWRKRDLFLVGSSSCVTLGYQTGTLTCNGSCTGFNSGAWRPANPVAATSLGYRNTQPRSWVRRNRGAPPAACRLRFAGVLAHDRLRRASPRVASLPSCLTLAARWPMRRTTDEDTEQEEARRYGRGPAGVRGGGDRVAALVTFASEARRERSREVTEPEGIGVVKRAEPAPVLIYRSQVMSELDSAITRAARSSATVLVRAPSPAATVTTRPSVVRRLASPLSWSNRSLAASSICGRLTGTTYLYRNVGTLRGVNRLPAPAAVVNLRKNARPSDARLRAFSQWWTAQDSNFFENFAE